MIRQSSNSDAHFILFGVPSGTLETIFYIVYLHYTIWLDVMATGTIGGHWPTPHSADTSLACSSHGQDDVDALSS